MVHMGLLTSWLYSFFSIWLFIELSEGNGKLFFRLYRLLCTAKLLIPQYSLYIEKCFFQQIKFLCIWVRFNYVIVYNCLDN